jgi:endonuclease/exonuclease/phosphatase family metal-dependent hydrolase
MRIATYNIRYDNPRDSGNLWVDRLPRIVDLLRYHDFDILGTQEGLTHQLDQLKKELDGYEMYGIGRDDGKKAGEHSAIFYKKGVFDLLDKGDFWLSSTPDVPGKGWDANINRICSWIKLKEKSTKNIFFVFNVHFDHQGTIARRESSRLLIEKIPSVTKDLPFILMGDLNGNQESEWYSMLQNCGFMKDAMKLAEKTYAPNGTFNGFRFSGISTDIIDHIFISDSFHVKGYAILTDSYLGKYPSDHFPVSTTLLWDTK